MPMLLGAWAFSCLPLGKGAEQREADEGNNPTKWGKASLDDGECYTTQTKRHTVVNT